MFSTVLGFFLTTVNTNETAYIISLKYSSTFFLLGLFRSSKYPEMDICSSHESQTLHSRQIFLSEVHMNTSHVMSVKAGFGCEMKSSSSHLFSLCSPLLLFPPSACVSGQMAEYRSICGGGGAFFPFTDQGQVSSTIQLIPS